jgi:wobble nucleotide-excising tRNase
MSAKLSRTVFDENKGKPWVVETWLVGDDGKEFCQSVKECEFCHEARRFRKQQGERYFDPMLNLGAGI